MKSLMSEQRGFTMLELFSVVVVSGVLAMAGMPLIEDYQRTHAAADTQHKFAESLTVARERAVGGAVSVFVCASADGATCSTDWDKGWLVYEGLQKKQSGESVPAEQIIQHIQIVDEAAEFHVFDESLTAVSEIRFDSRGFNTASQRLMAMSCELGVDADAVFVERSGRVRIGKNSGEQENPSFRCQRV